MLADALDADAFQFLPALVGVPGGQLQAFPEPRGQFLEEARRPENPVGTGGARSCGSALHRRRERAGK
jgi:hypothetical protein